MNILVAETKFNPSTFESSLDQIVELVAAREDVDVERAVGQVRRQVRPERDLRLAPRLWRCNSIEILNFGLKTGCTTGPSPGTFSVLEGPGNYKF